jgi:hypothetical protein
MAIYFSLAANNIIFHIPAYEMPLWHLKNAYHLMKVTDSRQNGTSKNETTSITPGLQHINWKKFMEVKTVN